MPDDFVIARNPDPDSSLPFLVRIPLGERGIVLKVRDTWPRTSKVYCHRAPGWPADVEVVERVPVRSCVRRGAAIDLVLDRGRENRSQFVITRIRGGREAIFWQSARTTKQARPNFESRGAPVGWSRRCGARRRSPSIAPGHGERVRPVQGTVTAQLGRRWTPGLIAARRAGETSTTWEGRCWLRGSAASWCSTCAGCATDARSPSPPGCSGR